MPADTGPLAPTPHALADRPGRVILIAATVLLISMGVRATSGLFMSPMLAAHDWSRQLFSTAFAVQNLAWGFGAIAMGMLADRHGASRAIALSALLYAAGMAGTRFSDTPAELMLWSGLVVGLGQGGTTAALLMPVVARVSSAAGRGAALGMANAGGSLGQFAVVPATHVLIGSLDWSGALLVLSVLVGMIAPLALAMRAGPPAQAREAGALGVAVRRALAHAAFRRLGASYFVCGFQLAFVTLHLPAYVVDHGLTARDGALAIALIGLFNVLGSLLVGPLGARMGNTRLLGWVYALRAVFIAQILLLPLTPLTLAVFSAGMGLLWLSTVPLTMGLVGQIFGLRFAATLGGIVFLSHQLGSAAGVWLAGAAFEATGSYDTMWIASIALAIGAALLAWRVDGRPLEARAAA